MPLTSGLDIDHLGRNCLQSFKNIYTLLGKPDSPWLNDISPADVRDEQGRFKVWADNIGALQHRQMTSSLEYRLQDASHTRQRVLRFVETLQEFLDQSIPPTRTIHANIYFTVEFIISGKREGQYADNSEDDGLSSSSDGSSISASLNAEPVSELRELLTGVADSITGLFKLSLILRNAVPRDRYAKAASIDTFSNQYDIDYVWHKFPYPRQRDPPDEWLIERLGKANARRREYFKYCKRHHQKLAQVPEAPKMEAAPSEEIPLSQHSSAPIAQFDNGTQSHIPSDRSASVLQPTTASTYIEKLHETMIEEHLESQSVTSYATSLENKDEEELSLPPQPKESMQGMPFECPYCYTIQIVKHERAWK